MYIPIEEKLMEPSRTTSDVVAPTLVFTTPGLTFF